MRVGGFVCSVMHGRHFPPERRTPTEIEGERLSLPIIAGPFFSDSKLHGAVTVRANWRVIFRFSDGDAFDVDYVDYH